MEAQTIVLDGVEFEPMPGDVEKAWRAGDLIGELALVERDDVLTSAWKARKLYANQLGEWRPMRSRAEARAFIVSKVRQ